MKKSIIIMTTFVACFISSTSVFAFDSMSGLSTPMGSSLSSLSSFSLNINIPHDASLRPTFSLPTTPVMSPTTDFDATQIPVHELPPLPLTLQEMDQAH
ncbi:hypothetical protein [Kaarinaea lacus]